MSDADEAVSSTHVDSSTPATLATELDGLGTGLPSDTTLASLLDELDDISESQNL